MRAPKEFAFTDAELLVVARILKLLGDVPDWDRRIDVAACAIKIGIMTNPGENDWVDRIRAVAYGGA